MKYTNKYKSRKPWEQNYGEDWRSKSRQYKTGKSCSSCGWKPLKGQEKYLHVDHIIPLSKGGLNTEWNMQALCAKCHCLKHPGNKVLQQAANEMRNHVT